MAAERTPVRPSASTAPLSVWSLIWGSLGHHTDGLLLYEAPRATLDIGSSHLSMIQEGLRGVVRLPDGTAHSLDSRDFPIPVMGKTGTTSDFHDALFVGSTYGRQGITVAVRIGFDDNRTLGELETGGRTALPNLPAAPARATGAASRLPAVPR